MDVLVHYTRFHKDTNLRAYYVNLGSRWIAYDWLYSVELFASNGRSKTGFGHKFYVLAPEWFISHYQEYKLWRFGIRAFSSFEAIQRAHEDKRIARLYAAMWRRQFNQEICNG